MAKPRKKSKSKGKSASETSSSAHTSRWSAITPEPLHATALAPSTGGAAATPTTQRGRKVTQISSADNNANASTREYFGSITLSCLETELDGRDGFVHSQHAAHELARRERRKKASGGGRKAKGGGKRKGSTSTNNPAATNDPTSTVEWSVCLGDAIALSDADAVPPTQATLERNSKLLPSRTPEMERTWYPFRRPWGVVQVLSIYRDAGGSIRLEVRRLYRHTNLVGGVPGLEGDARLGCADNDSDVGAMEEVLETFKVIRDVSLDDVVGKVVLRDEVGQPFVTARHLQPPQPHGGEKKSKKRWRELERESWRVPAVSFLCHRFYASGEEQVMPLLHAAAHALERCLGRSELVRDDVQLQIPLRWRYKLRLRFGGTAEGAEAAAASAAACIVSTNVADSATVRLPPPLLAVGTARQFYDSARLPIDWAVFQYGRDIVCGGSAPPTVRRWTARVGDVVALRADGDDDDALPPQLSEWVQEKGGNAWYPFTSATKWRPCRVVAIYTDGETTSASSASSWTDADDATKVRFELQLLYRTADVQASDSIHEMREKRNRTDGDEAYDVDLVEMDKTVETNASFILGPVAISEREQIPLSDWTTPPVIRSPCRLPVSYLRCWKHFDEQVKPIVSSAGSRLIATSEYYSKSMKLSDVIKDVLDSSNFSHDTDGLLIEVEADSVARRPDVGNLQEDVESDIDHDHRDTPRRQASKRRKVLAPKAAASEVGRPPDHDDESHEEEMDSDESSDEEMDDGNQAWTTAPPFHVDVASSRSYYTKLHVHPPYDHYAPQFTKTPKDDSDDKVWTVSIGDTVAVHFDVGGNVGNGPKLPFTATWCPAEIVCIWKEHRDKDDVIKLKDKGSDEDSDEGADSARYEMRMEVRWLYRQHEMPGSARQTFSAEKSGGLEEVIETDDTLDCPAAALLAPIKLYSSSVPCDVPTIGELGMPVISYQCHRFWSIYRKSLMPSGSIKGRVERGRMYSNYFGKDALLKASLDKVLGGAIESAVVAPSDKTSTKAQLRRNFREAISRLSLSDASADAQIRGMELTGRTKELNQIKDFLRSAIQGAKNEFQALDGTEIESSVKSSIFIAGPPGTGKTACVKAVIAQLRHEQASGDIPQFDFVSLNGMEMQYPFDAYVRLWEAISEFKEKRTPGVAAAMLERHFVGSSSKKSSGSNEGSRRPVTVVLLDEIDYLVTNKQSVLYNFFEWPRRSATNTSGARLVVIGISNTINLPERLKPAVQSRLGRERCIFKAYNVEETCNILKARLIGSDGAKNVSSVFDADALTFAARKTAVMSGDIRKAFQICKSAAETILSKMEEEVGSSQSGAMPPLRRSGGAISAPTSASKIVRIPDIQRAARDMFNSIINRAISTATSFEALLIVSVASLQKHTGREKGGFDVQEILTKMKGVAESLGDRQYLPPPTFSELLGILNRLGEARVITLQTPKGLHASYHAALGGGGGAWPLVSLRMEDYEVEAALRDTPHNALAQKHLAEGGLF